MVSHYPTISKTGCNLYQTDNLLNNGEFEILEEWKINQSQLPWRVTELAFGLVGKGFRFFAPQKDIHITQDVQLTQGQSYNVQFHLQTIGTSNIHILINTNNESGIVSMEIGAISSQHSLWTRVAGDFIATGTEGFWLNIVS